MLLRYKGHKNGMDRWEDNPKTVQAIAVTSIKAYK